MGKPILVIPEGEMLERIKKEVNEDDRTRDQDLAAIKCWLKQQPHLPDDWVSEDIILMNFLRGCKFSLEKTKRKLENYFTLRTACPEFYTDRDITRPELQEILAKAEFPTMPGLTPDGRRVNIYRSNDKTLQTDKLVHAMKISLMLGDVRVQEEVAGIASDIFVLDASIVTVTHLATVSPSLAKKFLLIAQEALAVRLNEVHVINIPPFIDTILTMVKPFLKEKIRKRIYTHTDPTSLQKYIPKDMLPPDYGGSGPPLAEIWKAWEDKLLEYREWFKKQESVKSNEALRPGTPTNYDELFGIDGSFRQLTID